MVHYQGAISITDFLFYVHYPSGSTRYVQNILGNAVVQVKKKGNRWTKSVIMYYIQVAVLYMM